MIAAAATYGGLDCVVVRSAVTEPKLALVLCHGFGASGEDLLGLAEPLLQMVGERAEEIAVIFPAGVLSLDDRGLPGGRAWWWIDLDRLLNQPTPEIMREFRSVRPAGMTEATAMVCQLVSEVQQQFQLKPAQIVLGGFSQGSMIATDVAMTLPEPPAGLIIYSGALICESDWKERAARLASTKIVQSHGRRDPILHISQGMALRDVFTAAGCQPKYLEFNGFHEIHPAAVTATAELLKSLLP